MTKGRIAMHTTPQVRLSCNVAKEHINMFHVIGFLLFHKVFLGYGKRNHRSDQRTVSAILAIFPQKQMKTL